LKDIGKTEIFDDVATVWKSPHKMYSQTSPKQKARNPIRQALSIWKEKSSGAGEIKRIFELDSKKIEAQELGRS